MAKQDSTGIKVEERHWATVHIGRMDELIAAGLAKPEEFPGMPGCGKTSTIFRTADGKRKLKKVSRRSTSCWEVAVYRTPGETAAFEATERKEIEAAALKEGVLPGGAEAPAHDSRPCSVEQLAAAPWASIPPDVRGPFYRDAFTRCAKRGLFGLHLLFEGKTEDPKATGYLPYRLSAAQRREAKDAIAALFSIIKHAHLEATPIAKAQADPTFQRFLNAAVGDCGAVKG